MSSINRVTLLGHAGKAETRYTANGVCILTISLATQEKVKDKETDEIKYVPEWHRVVCFGKVADAVSLIVDKGSKLFIEGTLKTNKYKDKQTGQDRFSTQINAFHVEVIHKNSAPSEKYPAKELPKEVEFDDSMDIPF